MLFRKSLLAMRCRLQNCIGTPSGPCKVERGSTVGTSHAWVRPVLQQQFRARCLTCESRTVQRRPSRRVDWSAIPVGLGVDVCPCAEQLFDYYIVAHVCRPVQRCETEVIGAINGVWCERRMHLGEISHRSRVQQSHMIGRHTNLILSWYGHAGRGTLWQRNRCQLGAVHNVRLLQRNLHVCQFAATVDKRDAAMSHIEFLCDSRSQEPDTGVRRQSP